MRHLPLIGFLVLAAGTLGASPASDVREAIERLKSESNYAWVVTSTSEEALRASTGRPSPARRSPGRIIASGRRDRESVAIITTPNPLLRMDVTAVRMANTTVAHTPLGWLSLDEIQRAYRDHQDAEVRFEGRSVRLFQALGAARMAVERETPEQQLTRLLGELTGFAGTRREVSGQLTTDGAVAVSFIPAVARSITSHRLEGAVVFRFEGGRLVEYEVNVTGKVQMRGATTERDVFHREVTAISGFGSTMVVAPPDAFARLIR